LTKKSNDHGGGLDGAARQYGGKRTDWIDLSTGINPLPYGVSGIQPDAWTALPDQTAATNLTDAARAFWTEGTRKRINRNPKKSRKIEENNMQAK